ncbi:hypothetical protein C0992_002621 [Termitomyces sp. T32_za158]|nr:hypothetical protein C0992_002621 [Termitomyces sp. T32_za158]
MPSIKTISRGAVDKPFITSEDDDDPAPPTDEEKNPDPAISDDPVPHEQPKQVAEQAPNQLQWSTQIPIPTAQSRPDKALETTTQQAVRELRELAECICKVRVECQHAIEELHCERSQGPPDNEERAVNLDEILAALNAIKDKLGIDASNVDPEVPKTLNQAQKSPDAKRWKTVYDEELKSL